MFNMVKMDLYRMFNSKSLYIIGIIMACLIFLTTGLLKMEFDSYEMKSDKQIHAVNEDNVNLGMSVFVEPDEDGEVTVLNDFFANVSAKFLALFLVIFTVIFSTADYTSGYIKNIAGQVNDRSIFILSKAVSLFIYTIISVFWFLFIQILAHLIILGYVKLGDIRDLVSYVSLQILLNYAFLIIVMIISIILRNNLISMIIAICLCMNVMVILYNAIDKLLEKIGLDNFTVVKCTITGRISMLEVGGSVRENILSIAVSVIFIIVSMFIGIFVFKKRDIV